MKIKKLLIAAIAILLMTGHNANAMPAMSSCRGLCVPPYYYHSSPVRDDGARDSARTAKAVAVVSVGVAIIALAVAVKASEHNRGHVQLARF
jgi:hypothetical protein